MNDRQKRAWFKKACLLVTVVQANFKPFSKISQVILRKDFGVWGFIHNYVSPDLNQYPHAGT